MLADYMESLPYEIQGWEVGDDDFVLSIRVNGSWFKIPVSPQCFINSPHALRSFREVFAKMITGEDFEVWDYSEEIAILFIPHFQRLAPPTTAAAAAHSGNLTLAELASPGTFECEYQVVDEKPVAWAVRPRSPDTPQEAWNLEALRPPFPVFDMREVEVPFEHGGGGSIYDIVPQLVLVQRRQLYYKACEWPCDAVQELTKYIKIQASGLSLSREDLRVPRLAGIVSDKNGYLNGFLYDWIETQATAEKMALIISPETPTPLKEKWTLQIQSTVAKLHQIGVIWGDAKADNIIIDKNGDAVVVGLEGGSTEGWVDHDKADTVEGDLQGLERLVDFINNDESQLRLHQQLDEDDLDEEMTDG